MTHLVPLAFALELASGRHQCQKALWAQQPLRVNLGHHTPWLWLLLCCPSQRKWILDGERVVEQLSDCSRCYCRHIDVSIPTDALSDVANISSREFDMKVPVVVPSPLEVLPTDG